MKIIISCCRCVVNIRVCSFRLNLNSLSWREIFSKSDWLVLLVIDWLFPCQQMRSRDSWRRRTGRWRWLQPEWTETWWVQTNWSESSWCVSGHSGSQDNRHLSWLDNKVWFKCNQFGSFEWKSAYIKMSEKTDLWSVSSGLQNKSLLEMFSETVFYFGSKSWTTSWTTSSSSSPNFRRLRRPSASSPTGRRPRRVKGKVQEVRGQTWLLIKIIILYINKEFTSCDEVLKTNRSCSWWCLTQAGSVFEEKQENKSTLMSSYLYDWVFLLLSSGVLGQ